jgi:hypothetical protein
MKYILLLNLLFSNTYGFTPVNVFKSNYKDTAIKVYKPQLGDSKESLKNIVFYTGGNSIIPPEIYNNFLKTLASSYYNIYVATNNKDTNEELFDELEDSESETILIGHSTGCVNAIDESNNNKFIKKMILMDPVNNKNVFDIGQSNFNTFTSKEKKNNLELKYINDILLVNAQKSYEWSIFPSFNVPFIPAFAMTEEKIYNLKSNIKNNDKNNLNVKVIKANEYGHSDILDSMYSDFMHNTISKGNDARDEQTMYEYYVWLTEQINDFVESKQELLLKNEESNEENCCTNITIVHDDE